MGLARLLIQLGVDNSMLAAGFRRAEGMAMGFGRSIGSHIRGLVGVAFSTYAVKSVVDYGGHIKDLSEQFGVATQTIQEWDYAAKQTGTTVEAFGAAYKRLAVNRPDLKGKELLAEFNRIANAVRGGNLGQNELAIVTELLGKSAHELLPAFHAGLGELGAVASSLGLIWKDEVISGLDEFGDKLEELKGQLTGPFASAVVGVGTALMQSINTLVGAAKVLPRNLKSGQGIVGAVASSVLESANQQAILHVIGDPAKTRREEALARARASSGRLELPDTTRTTTRVIAGQLNAWQQMGSFTAISPMTTEQRKQTNLLQKIEKNTFATRNLNTIQVD